MIRYRRPDRPVDFDPATEALDGIASRIDADTGELLPGQDLKSGDFVNTWGDHKELFNLAQHRKCAYCERVYTGYGDVEHVFPKTEVHRLGDDGQELSSGRVTGRRVGARVKPGYWWLANTWENYCFACNHCNSRWKKNFLDVVPPHSAEDPPRPGRSESVLFLHPYDHNPEEHLKVRRDGIVEPSSEIGRGAISTLGLNRPSLIQYRQDAYRDAWNAARLFGEGDEDLDLLLQHVHPRRLFALARRCAVAEVIGQDIYLELLQLV